MSQARYRRVVLKLSGEALAGPTGSGVDPASVARVAREILAVHDLGGRRPRHPDQRHEVTGRPRLAVGGQGYLGQARDRR